jgi:hypothetical protein
MGKASPKSNNLNLLYPRLLIHIALMAIELIPFTQVF